MWWLTANDQRRWEMFRNKRHIQGALQRPRKRRFTLHETGVKDRVWSLLCCLPVIAMEPGSCYLCLAWSCCPHWAATVFRQATFYVITNLHGFVWIRSGFSSFKGSLYAAVMHDHVFDEEEQAACPNIIITPCWCLGTKDMLKKKKKKGGGQKKKEGERIWYFAILHAGKLRRNGSDTVGENSVTYVWTLYSYLSDVTNNTPGPVYPWSFALCPG